MQMRSSCGQLEEQRSRNIILLMTVITHLTYHFCRRMAQASASTAAIAPNVRLSMPDGTVLGKARERERRGSIVSLTLLELTPAGREHPAFGDSEQVPRDMTVNNAIYNVQVSPLASTSS
ncbi:uncharacterized protein LOC144867110 [Branchiostoma floridae x Branchiostoma japonicum]